MCHLHIVGTFSACHQISSSDSCVLNRTRERIDLTGTVQVRILEHSPGCLPPLSGGTHHLVASHPEWNGKRIRTENQGSSKKRSKEH